MLYGAAVTASAAPLGWLYTQSTIQPAEPHNSSANARCVYDGTHISTAPSEPPRFAKQSRYIRHTGTHTHTQSHTNSTSFSIIKQ